MSESETYNLVVTKDPATDIADYASFGAIRYENVVPPFELDDLDSGEPVYLALEVIDSVSSWTSFTPLAANGFRSEEHTSELQSRGHLVCRLLLEKKNN